MRCFTGRNHSVKSHGQGCVALEPSYPEGNFEGNQLLGGSIGLSPLCRTQATQFARQNSDRPPPQFPTASSWHGIVHHLSGPTDLASTQNPVLGTSGPVTHAARRGTIWVGESIAFTEPWPPQERRRGASSGDTSERASAVDSLVRVSRRAVGSTAMGSKLRASAPRTIREARGRRGGHQRGGAATAHRRAPSRGLGSGDWHARRRARLSLAHDAPRGGYTRVCLLSVLGTARARTDRSNTRHGGGWGGACRAPHTRAPDVTLADPLSESSDEPQALAGRVPPRGPPRLRPRLRARAQRPAPGWPRVAWNEWSSLRATALLTADPAEASGTFNPLCKVLCILQSLYLCAIGPMLVLLLGMDTHPASNCSPKPLYSWIQAAALRWPWHSSRRTGQ